MEAIEKLIENEIKFCKEIDCEVNEHGKFIYQSINQVSIMNLPHVLQEYKQWLIDNKIVELKQ